MRRKLVRLLPILLLAPIACSDGGPVGPPTLEKVAGTYRLVEWVETTEDLDPDLPDVGRIDDQTATGWEGEVSLDPAGIVEGRLTREASGALPRIIVPLLGRWEVDEEEEVVRIRVVILMPYVFEWTGRRLRGSFEQASVQLPGPDDPDGIEQPIRRTGHLVLVRVGR